MAPGGSGRVVSDAGHRQSPERLLEVADDEFGGHRDEPVDAGDQRGLVAALPVEMAFEQVDCILDQVLHVGGVAHGESGQLLDGHSLSDEGAGRYQHLDVVEAETLAVGAVVQRREQSGADHQINDEGGDAGPLGQSGPVENETGTGGIGRGGAVGHVHHARSRRRHADSGG